MKHLSLSERIRIEALLQDGNAGRICEVLNRGIWDVIEPEQDDVYF